MEIQLSCIIGSIFSMILFNIVCLSVGGGKDESDLP